MTRFGSLPVRTLAALAPALASGCISVGPTYQPVKPPSEAAYKEAGPWAPATPKDDVIRADFWQMYGDQELNGLENQVNLNNLTIAAALANFQEARALVRESAAAYMPTLSFQPAINTQYGTTSIQTGKAPSTATGRATQYQLPLDASWGPDLWGRIEHQVNAAVANAQISAADLENQRLLQHAQLASAYFQIRAQDSLQHLLDASVAAYEQALTLTKTLSRTGIGAEEAVVEAETQLATVKAQSLDLGIQRAKLEHAIALLIGKPPAAFSLPVRDLTIVPPGVPIAVPSKLLERRPDVAAAERAVYAANEQIGVAMAAYYPDLSLTGGIGYGQNSIIGLSKLPTLFWSLGASLGETIFDGGLRSATVDQYRALYDQTAANYRQTVLTAFEQVEDALAGIRVLEKELAAQNVAVDAAQRFLKIATDRYRLGLDPYLDVISAQTSLLTAQRAQITVALQQLTTTVDLIQALGGSWDRTKLPTEKQIREGG